jgi:hypothetical protein
MVFILFLSLLIASGISAQDEIQKAVANRIAIQNGSRLPKVSVVLYTDSERNSQSYIIGVGQSFAKAIKNLGKMIRDKVGPAILKNHFNQVMSMKTTNCAGGTCSVVGVQMIGMDADIEAIDTNNMPDVPKILLRRKKQKKVPAQKRFVDSNTAQALGKRVKLQKTKGKAPLL